MSEKETAIQEKQSQELEVKTMPKELAEFYEELVPFLNPRFHEEMIVSAQMKHEIDEDFGFVVDVPEISRQKDFLGRKVAVVRISEEMEIPEPMDPENTTFMNVGFITEDRQFHEISVFGNLKENLVKQYLTSSTGRRVTDGWLTIPMRLMFYEGQSKTGRRFYGVKPWEKPTDEDQEE